MSTDINKILEYAEYRHILSNQLHKSKVRCQAGLTISKSGGQFKITPALISVVSAFSTQGITSAVLLDNNDMPVMINDMQAFLSDITHIYEKVTTDYYAEYQSIKSARSARSIIDSP